MKAKEIERHLAQLGQELTDLGITSPVQILLVGGAFMLTQMKVRRTTDDIDVLPLDEDKRDEITGTPLAVALWTAAQAVATKHHLPPLWFNTLIGDFVRSTGGVPQSTLWRSYGPLEVYLPPKPYILVLKLLANRPKDRADIKVLCKALNIHTREQAQDLINTYIPDQEVQTVFSIPAALNAHFRE